MNYFLPITKISERNMFFITLLFSVLYFVSLSLILPIRFEENDDVIMLLFASGQYTGNPEFRLVFINSVYGLFLKALYSFTNKIEWYSLSFSIIHIFSLSIILWSIIRKNSLLVWKIMFILFFLILEARFIAQFQFTTTAAIGALGGLILCSYDKRKYKYIGFILFVISSLVRFEAAIMVFILFSPIFINSFLVSRKIREIKFIVYLLSTVLFFYGMNFISYQVDKDWKEYSQYNKIRGQINDNPNIDKIINDLPAGITKTDYQLLTSFFPDYHVLNYEKLKSIKSVLNSVPLADKLSNIYPALRKHFRIILLIVAFSLIIILSVTKNNRLIAILTLILFLFVLSVLAMNSSLKYRVVLSAVLVVMYSLFLIEFKISKFSMVSGLMIIGYFSLIMLIRTKNIVRKTENWEILEFNMQKLLLDNFTNDNNCYVSPFASSLSIEYYSPFKISNNNSLKVLSFGGWCTGIPYNKNKIDTHELFINQNAVFVSNESFSFITELVVKNIMEAYNIKTEVKVLAKNEKYQIIRFTTLSSL